MKSLETLIKIKQSELDEKRLAIISLENQKAEMLDYSEKMQQELKTEEEFAAKDPYAAMTFDSYRSRIKERQANISLAVRDINRQLAVINNEMADIFGEMKKYEIVLERKIAEEKARLKSEEEKILDEVAINGHVRNGD